MAYKQYVHFKTAYNITEQEIRYAMANSISNSGAARFLGISRQTYSNYAKLYIDEETGKDLWELHKNPANIGSTSDLKKKNHSKYFAERFEKFITGELPRPMYFDRRDFLKKLLKHAVVPEKCFQCGFDEKRITDDMLPVVLDFKDDDDTNLKLENLQLLCFNCFFLNGGKPNEINRK